MKRLDKASTWRTTLLLIQACLPVALGKRAITSQLMSHLFVDYNSQLLPACEPGQHVNMSLDIALRQIINLDEKEQVLTTNVWMRMHWADCQLEWNTTEFGPDYMYVPYATIWIPDLALYDSCAEEVAMPGRELYNAQITPDGLVSYFFPTVLKSVCKVKVTYFPFDKQTCQLKFGSWSYSIRDIDIYPVNPKGDISNYIENNEWVVIDLPAERVVQDYGNSSFPDVRYYLHLRRRPAFYTMTMLFPCILTSAIALTGFLLPCDSGEKVSLEVTVLLAMAVFLLVISDFLPPSADSFPIIGTYFAASMILVSLSLLLSIVTLNIHYRGVNGRVPNWARRIFLEKLGICGKKATGFELQEETSNKNPCYPQNCRTQETKEDSQMARSFNNINPQANPGTGSDKIVIQLIQENTNILGRIETSITDRDKQDAISGEWQQLARVLDRMFLVIYLLTSVIVTIVMWVQLNEEP